MRALRIATLAAALAVAASTATGPALAASPTYAVWGLGAKTCGAWTDAERTDVVRAEAYQSWVHAFVTGAAYGRGGLKLKNVDIRAEAFTKWVSEYCLANPRMTVERAAVGLLDHISDE